MANPGQNTNGGCLGDAAVPRDEHNTGAGDADTHRAETFARCEAPALAMPIRTHVLSPRQGPLDLCPSARRVVLTAIVSTSQTTRFRRHQCRDDCRTFAEDTIDGPHRTRSSGGRGHAAARLKQKRLRTKNLLFFAPENRVGFAPRTLSSSRQDMGGAHAG